jgi:hypothetical protein
MTFLILFSILNLVGSNQCFYLGGFFLFEMVEKNVFELFNHQIWTLFLVNKWPNSTIGSSNSAYHDMINFFLFCQNFTKWQCFFQNGNYNVQKVFFNVNSILGSI